MVCEVSGEKDVATFNVNSSGVIRNGGKPMAITLFTRELLAFKWDSEIKETNRRIVLYARFNLIDGSGTITMEYQDKKDPDYDYQFTCSEQ